MVENLRPLTQEQRQDARVAAHEAVVRAVGPRPSRDQFIQHATNKYPPEVTRLITTLCMLLLLAAFTPSSIRLFSIGFDTFGKTINNTVAKHLVGVATVLSAETGQVVFSLAVATLGTTRSARRLLYTSMGIATMIALVGNIQVALPDHTRSPFAWFEAIAPPLLVLSTAYILKEQMLNGIQQRHANEQAFQDALAEWQVTTQNPEKHPRWHQLYANALRDALRKVNNRRKETLQSMTTADWRAAIYREHQADDWYAQPEPVTVAMTPETIDEDAAPAEAAAEEQVFVPFTLTAASNGNGRH